MLWAGANWDIVRSRLIASGRTTKEIHAMSLLDISSFAFMLLVEGASTEAIEKVRKTLRKQKSILSEAVAKYEPEVEIGPLSRLATIKPPSWWDEDFDPFEETFNYRM